MDRRDAWDILSEFTKSESLLRHALAVEAAMRHLARHYGRDVDRWGTIGLLHDFDYERWPDPPDHTRKGAEILRQRGADDEIIDAMLSHAQWNQDTHPRDTLVRKALYAVDELCGFIMAVGYVRPDKLAGMTPKSVKKKLKDKSFAAAVSRDDISSGAELLGVDLTDHVARCIEGLQAASSELGL